MKILIYKKEKMFFYIIIAIMVLIIAIFIVRRYHTNVCCVAELTENSIISEETFNKISTITKNKEKVAYLTFDDGPSKNVTPKILDILKEEDKKATFFVIGKKVEENQSIVKRAYEEGHYIANHGYDHDNFKLYKSKESFKNEVTKTDEAISKAINVQNYCSHLFRFPNGFMSPQNKRKKKEAVQTLTEMNYTYIDWNCLNNDSIKKISDFQLINNLKKSSKNKGTLVVLMHDTKDVNDTSRVLKESIEYIRSQGYEFKNFYSLIENE